MSVNRLPTACPSCSEELSVVSLKCTHCTTSVEGEYSLPLLAQLAPDDQVLVSNFILCSGSLKDLARLYKVSYPTVRNRLDTLISKVRDLVPETDNPQEG